MRKITTLILLAFAISVSAQHPIVEGSYIIKVTTDNLDLLRADLDLDGRAASASIKAIAADDGLYVVEGLFGDEAVKWLDANPLVDSWSHDYYVSKRTTPDDEYYDMQWGLELIDAPLAWEVSTGGSDSQGREIVVAILDEGFGEHFELEKNRLINDREIPNDGIDNDMNGYIDDYLGWDTTSESDQLPETDNHGIAVAGIIGAHTDNGQGVAGINWDVKLLFISGIARVSETIAAYQYVYDQRKLYNDTNGENGRYIVVNNYSAGIDGFMGTDPEFLEWCGMYDKLASVGVLSIGSTANRNIDVDIEGDIPTTCPSPYLISVTNVDSNDAKWQNAGYGATNIDLGAPGRGTFALDLDDGYDQSFGGTSAAAPHVAGAVALLYALPCEAISAIATTAPELAAQYVRDAILLGVDDNITLAGITATGGRLNIYSAVEQMQDICSELEIPSVTGPLEIISIYRASDESVTINYVTPNEESMEIILYDALGRIYYQSTITPPEFGRKIASLPVTQLAQSIYFVALKQGQETVSKSFFLLD